MAKSYTYDWETCILTSDEWKHMIERRNDGGWRMVSVRNVTTVNGTTVAYVFWEKATSPAPDLREVLEIAHSWMMGLRVYDKDDNPMTGEQVLEKMREALAGKGKA